MLTLKVLTFTICYQKYKHTDTQRQTERQTETHTHTHTHTHRHTHTQRHTHRYTQGYTQRHTHIYININIYIAKLLNYHTILIQIVNVHPEVSVYIYALNIYTSKVSIDIYTV